MKKSSTLLFLIPKILAFSGCGASYETVKVKEYRLAVLDDNPRFNAEFAKLIDDYNRLAGTNVLTLVDDPGDANSAIVITSGLRQRDDKVGWGQALTETREQTPLITTPGTTLKREITYSMRLEFDKEYLLSRLDEENPDDLHDKQKLFFHEVGHGLEMDHHSRKSDVMYFNIAGKKDFTSYFERVRKYMADR